MIPISVSAAQEVEAFYRSRAVTPDDMLGEATGPLQPGSTCFVVGPLIERSLLISRLVGDAAASGAASIYASAHRRDTRVVQEVTASRCATDLISGLEVIGVTDQSSRLSEELADNGPRLRLVAIDDGTVLRPPDTALLDGETRLHGWQRLARQRQLAVIVGIAVLPDDVQNMMLSEDRLVEVSHLSAGDLSFRVTVSGPRRTIEHLLAQELPDRLRVERVC